MPRGHSEWNFRRAFLWMQHAGQESMWRRPADLSRNNGLGQLRCASIQRAAYAVPVSEFVREKFALLFRCFEGGEFFGSADHSEAD